MSRLVRYGEMKWGRVYLTGALGTWGAFELIYQGWWPMEYSIPGYGAKVTATRMQLLAGRYRVSDTLIYGLGASWSHAPDASARVP